MSLQATTVRRAPPDRLRRPRRTMNRPCALWGILPALFVWGLVSCLRPTDVSARTQSFQEAPVALEEAGLLEVRNDKGYVDMGSDEAGDRFVDEDGDGLDDRLLRKHQRRNRRGWRDDDRRGTGPEDVERGSAGQKGPGGGPGGRGGR